MIPSSHHLLIVEDDPDTARILADFVRSIGMTARIASNLEEVDTALAEDAFCAALLDKQIPFAPGALALTSTGDLAQKRIRALDPRRNSADQHIFPILVISGAAADLAPTPQAAFVSRSFRDGATTYIPKPFDAETVTREVLAALERAGRAEHSGCAGLRARPAGARDTTEPEPLEPVVVLVLDGIRAGRRMTFSVNGKRRALPDAQFMPLLRLAAERVRGTAAYVPARELGINRAPEIPSRIRAAIADAVPEGFSILQRADAGLRLHPRVTVTSIAWEMFLTDSSPSIQAVAVAERRRRP